MTIIPARVAGVSEVVVCSPPREKGTIPPAVLVSCHLAGATEIYRIGGPQAIAAMAYGTASLHKVAKIFGPGNIYITAAKILAFPDVDIDMPAGPSEVLVLADEKADPRLIAADMISQAEHGPAGSSPAVLVTDSALLADRVRYEICRMVKEAPNRREIEASLNNCGALLLADDLDNALAFANEFAPEHLEIMLSDPKAVLERVVNAGTILLGDYSPVAAGDYATGANHVLPTGGFAKTRGGLSIQDFTKVITVQHLSKKGLEALRETVGTLAHAEQLSAHENAVSLRFQHRNEA
jgi:histidinol dehydrogenase